MLIKLRLRTVITNYKVFYVKDGHVLLFTFFFALPNNYENCTPVES
jgi:hypothetical protein